MIYVNKVGLGNMFYAIIFPHFSLNLLTVGIVWFGPIADQYSNNKATNKKEQIVFVFVVIFLFCLASKAAHPN